MRPLGYWIKEIDRLLDEGFGATVADQGLSRREWQVLDSIARGPAYQKDLDLALAPFQATVRGEVGELAGRGWLVAPEGGLIGLTAAGRVAHDRVAERVRAFRRRVADGLSEQEYATLIRLLERVAGNLAPA